MFKAHKIVQDNTAPGARQKEIYLYDETPEDHANIGFVLKDDDTTIAFLLASGDELVDDYIAYGLEGIARYLNEMENSKMNTQPKGDKPGIMDIIREYEMDTDYPCHERWDNLVMVFSVNLQRELEEAGYKPDEVRDYLGYEVAVYKLQ